jgi:predicted transcriptional regulator
MTAWAEELGVTQSTFSVYCKNNGRKAAIQYYKEKLKDTIRIIAEDADSYGIPREEFLAYCRKHGEAVAIKHFNIPLRVLSHIKLMTDPDTGERKTAKAWANLLGISKVTFVISCRWKGEKKTIQYYKEKLKEKIRMIKKNADDYGIPREEFLAYCRKHGEGAAIRHFKLQGKPLSQVRLLQDPDTGERKSMTAWARELGVTRTTINSYCQNNGTKDVIQRYKEQLKEKIRMIKEHADVHGISREEFFAYCREHGEGAATRHFNVPAPRLFHLKVMTDPDTGESKTTKEWANLFGVLQSTFRDFCRKKGEKEALHYFKEGLKAKIRLIEKNADDYGISREEFFACCREHGEGFAIKQFDLSKNLSSGMRILTDPDTGKRMNMSAWAKEFGVARSAISACCKKIGPNKTIQFYKNKSKSLLSYTRILTDPDTGKRMNISAWAKEFGVAGAAINACCKKIGPNKTIQFYKNKALRVKKNSILKKRP